MASDMKLLMENWRIYLEEEQGNDAALDNVTKQLAQNIFNKIKAAAPTIEKKVEKTPQKTNNSQVDEAGILLAVSFALAVPTLLGVIGSIVDGAKAVLGKDFSKPNIVMRLAKNLHHTYMGAIEKALDFIPAFKKLEPARKKKIADAVMIAIVASLAAASGAGAAHALKVGEFGHGAFETALAAAKSNEISGWLTKQFEAI